MSKHTRGPWKVIGPDSMHPSQAMVCAEVGVQIYSAPLTNETEANAHLIAAAPELLEACKTALNAIDLAFDVGAGQALEQPTKILGRKVEQMRDAVSAAIAKAEGRHG